MSNNDVLEWIEKQQHRMLDYIKKWCEINSYSQNITGLSILSQSLIQDFSHLAGQSQIISLFPRKVVNPQGTLIEAPLGQSLSFKKRPEAPIQVLLAGHMDTVFPSSCSFQTIEKLDDKTWRGPGIIDMKAGLAIMLIALEALERSPYANQIGWEILINPDEELGSPGSAHLFEAAARRNHIGMIFEPAFPDGAFVSKRKGSASYTLVLHGQAAHVGRDYSQGRSAIYALAEYIHRLEEIQKQNPEIILNVGAIEGGGAINVVPDLAIAKINVRSSQDETIENCLKILQELAFQIEKREGIKSEIVAQAIRFPKHFTVQLQRLFKMYEECAKSLDIPFAWRETGGACDGNLLAKAGLPTIDSLGAVGGKMHTFEEYLNLSSLTERAKLSALFLLKLAAGEFKLKDFDKYA